MTAAEKLLAEVLALPKSARAKLVARVNESLADEAEISPPDFVAEGRSFVERNRELLERLAM
jgi:hypothetical protein